MILTRTLKEKILEWSEVKNKLTEIKSEESELRDDIVGLLFDGNAPPEGTKNFELGSGYTLKVSCSYSRDVDSDVAKAVLKNLPRGYKKKLIRVKETLNKKGFDALTQEQHDIFDECISIKPNKPSLKIQEPEESDE